MTPLISLQLQFPNQAKSKNFSFNHQRYWSLRMFRNYTDQIKRYRVTPSLSRLNIQSSAVSIEIFTIFDILSNSFTAIVVHRVLCLKLWSGSENILRLYCFVILPDSPFCVHNFIDLILFSHLFTLLVFHAFLVLFYLRNSRIDVFVSDNHHFLASHSDSSSLLKRYFQ